MSQFKCEICDLGFEQRSKLQQHMRTSHPQQAVSAADLQAHLSGIAYPASKDDLLDYAPVKRDEELTKLMKRLPEQSYRDSAEVSRALGKVISHEDMPDNQPSKKGGKASLDSASASRLASLFTDAEFPKSTQEVQKIVNKQGSEDLQETVSKFSSKKFENMADLEKEFGRVNSQQA